MTKVLLLGYAPLPAEDPPMLSALNRRTWQLARALGEDGHEVLLLAVRAQGAYADEASLPAVIECGIEPGITYCAVRDRDFHAGPVLPGRIEQFAPQAVVAVGPRVGYRLAELGLRAPLWVDLYGYLMGEAQTTAYVFDDDSHLAAWHAERAVLEQADVFSACSLRQRYAVIGELGAVGRLHKGTAGYDFVRAMPSCIEPEPYEHTQTVIRGKLAAADDFVVLFSGGYNTWTDVETLFDGVTRAMRRNRHIRFVSTGGAIKGHDERTFARFRDLIQGANAFADRFAFTGWLPASQVPDYYLEADVGVNVDRFNYETLLGTRYRLNDMCKAGLPVITTLGTELSQELGRAGIGLTFRIGDGAGLAEAILRLASDRALRDDMAGRAARYAAEHWDYAHVLAPLRAWAREPTHAPDFGRAVVTEGVSPSAPFAPRSRIAQLAWLVETEGYARTAARALRALGRMVSRSLRAAAQVAAVASAQALLVQRVIAQSEAEAINPLRVIVIPSSDRALSRQALALVERVMPRADVALWASKREAAALEADARVRTIEPGAWVGGAPPFDKLRAGSAGVRGISAQARRLRAKEGTQVVLVVGLSNRRAEVSAWLAGARVITLDDDGQLREAVVAPLKALGRAAGCLWSSLQRLGWAALLGLVIIGLGVADAIGMLIRATSRRPRQ